MVGGRKVKAGVKIRFNDDPRLDEPVPEPGLKQSPTARRYYFYYRALGVVRTVGRVGAFFGIPHAGKVAKVGEVWKPLEYEGGEKKKGWFVRLLEWLLRLVHR